MSEQTTIQDTVRKIEFWAAAAILVLEVLGVVTAVLSDDWAGGALKPSEQRNRVNYFFSANLIEAFLLYLSFLWLNFRIVPALMRKQSVYLNVSLILVVLLLLWSGLAGIATYLRELTHWRPAPDAEQDRILQRSFFEAVRLMLFFGIYTVLKSLGIYFLHRSSAIQERFPFIRKETLVAGMIWMTVLFLLIVALPDGVEIITAWAIIVPSAILLYAWSFFSLIPKRLRRKRPFLSYLFKVFFIMAVASFLIGPLAMLVAAAPVTGFRIPGPVETGMMITIFNIVFQLFITVPFSWLVFKRHLKGNEELQNLRTELGRSTANLDFLRSQINPHFLFNALNTIYGTAIQEQAVRTSEAVEKLGEMMRFMLQENMQEKISLIREVDYLNNYISLQKLRTDAHPNIRINVDLEPVVDLVQIAPMLLIPIVENAFKHGISFREPSEIKVSLIMKGETLHFDVANSRHVRTEHDPEKDNNGIGLENVMQRLQLLYPGKHELLIRETRNDFFVHLTIALV